MTTDAGNDRAAGLRSRLQTELTDLSRLTTRFEAWVARLGAEALVAASPAAADHAHALRRAETAAIHQMSEAEEGLAADLRLSGSGAWARLHGDVTARLVATVRASDGHPEPEVLPITVVRGLAQIPTRPGAGRPTRPSWSPGSRCRSRWPPPSTGPRGRPTC